MALIACVYNPSNEYSSDYLNVFSNVFKKFHSDKKLVCFTEKKNYKHLPKNVQLIPLEYTNSWSKGWFSKLELFRPDINEDILYTDLDNIILKPLDPFFSLDGNRPAMIKDLDPRQQRLQSAIMWIPCASSEKKLVWESFVKNKVESPLERVKRADKYGDAAIIRDTLNRDNTMVIQEVLGKNAVISFHIHYKRAAKTEEERRKMAKEAYVVCFHGKNRKPFDYRTNSLVIENFVKYLSLQKKDEQ